jgi:hypothetical protein
MRLKGIGLVEQHIEKAVLAVVSIVFLAVLAMQFLLSPNVVEVGGQNYSPEDAFKPVESKAQEIAAQLNAPTVNLPEVDVLDITSRFKEQAEESVVPRESLIAFGDAPTIEGEQVTPRTGAAGEELIAAVVPPAPSVPQVASHRSTIDPFIANSIEGLAEVLPASQPYDKAVLTIQTSFDGTALHKALVADDEGGARPMPPNWWRTSLSVLGVEVEREQLGEDGTWGEATIVKPMPGTVDVVSEVRKARGFPDLANMIKSLESQAPVIQRPSYYPEIAGPKWVTPSEAAAAAAVESKRVEAERVLRRRDEAVVERDRLEEERGKEPNVDDRAAHGRWEQAQNRINAEADKIERANAELRAMGVDPEVGLPDSPVHDPAAFEPADPSLLSNDDLPMWTMDVYAETGATYRYRARVLMTNPAFGRSEALPESQKEMAANPVLPSAWSEWSGPVHLASDTQYFVTSASGGDGVGSGAGASTELFRFYYGYWRQERVPLEPGDTIAAEMKLPDPALLPIYTIPTEGAPRDPKVEPTPGPKSIRASVDAFLLDVSRLPSTGRRTGGSQFDVYLRDQSGNIAIRHPAEDTSGELYASLTRSARLGERQGAPEPQPEVRQRPIERRDEREQEPYNPKGPGGGGGGGGGGG